MTERSTKARLWECLIALVVVGIWIPLIVTLPMVLGGKLWRRVGWETDLPMLHLTQVALTSLFVVVFILITGRKRLFIPERPCKPWVFLLFLPLMFVNVSRGPLVELTAVLLLVFLLDNFLVGFWEEFFFRGVIQDRLAVLGPRLSLMVTAVLFGLIHANEGLLPVLIAIGIGLAFSVARAPLGLWPLVVIHGTIDLMVDLFERRWPHQFTLGASLVAVYFVVALVVLLRREGAPAAAPDET